MPLGSKLVQCAHAVECNQRVGFANDIKQRCKHMNLMIPVALIALRIHLYPRESMFALNGTCVVCPNVIDVTMRHALGRTASTNMIILIRGDKTSSILV